MEVKHFEGNGRMSRAVIVGDMLYLRGLTAEPPVGDVIQQTKWILNECENILNKYGSDKEHLVTATIYLKNMDDFEKMNSVWDNWVIKGYEPTRACVEARLSGEDYLVEVVLSAAVK